MREESYNIEHTDLARELIGEVIESVDTKENTITTESGKKIEIDSHYDPEYRADILMEVYRSFRGKKVYEVASTYYRSSFDSDKNGNIKKVFKIQSRDQVLISITIHEHISANDFRIPNKGVIMKVTK